MKKAVQEESILSREELDALLEEMPKVLSDREEEIDSARPQMNDDGDSCLPPSSKVLSNGESRSSKLRGSGA